jgi:hypothetical protein
MTTVKKVTKGNRIVNRWVVEYERIQAELTTLASCQDWSSDLKRRVLIKSMRELEASGLLNGGTAELEQSFQTRLTQTEKPVAKQEFIPMESRLYPQLQGRVNLMNTMPARKAERWKLLRTAKKRLEVLTGEEYTKGNLPYSRVNDVDHCTKCGSDRLLDKETSNSVCSNAACGDTQNFASHVCDVKDNDRDEHDAIRHQSLEHLKKFTDQYERGHPEATVEVLAKLSIPYNKIHFHDASKVQSCRTNLLMKTCRDIPKVFRRASDRLTKELKAESIPEYTGNQINQLLNQRKRLRMPDDQGADDHKQKKSFNNQIYIRQLGRANGMEQARLHFNAKTNKIHLQRVWTLEKECMNMEEKHGDQRDMSWALYPST